MATRRLPDGTTAHTLQHGGRERLCFLHLPQSLAKPAPLVLQLHGRGIDALMFDRWTGYSALADEAGFVLAMPAAVNEIWNDGRYIGGQRNDRDAVDDVGFLLALIDEQIASGAVDPARVYVVGMSNGAAMAGRLAWEQAERVAGIAQVAGTIASSIAASTTPRQPVPVLQIHGTKDGSMPYVGGRARLGLMRILLGPPAAPALGVDAWAARWVEANAASAGPTTDHIGADVTVRRWSGPTPASDVAFYRVDGGGHTWPSSRIWIPPHLGRVTRTIDATRLSWDFLSVHRLADA